MFIQRIIKKTFLMKLIYSFDLNDFKLRSFLFTIILYALYIKKRLKRCIIIGYRNPNCVTPLVYPSNLSPPSKLYMISFKKGTLFPKRKIIKHNVIVRNIIGLIILFKLL